MCLYNPILFWEDTDDTSTIGASEEGMWVAVGQEWQSFYYITLHTF